MLDEKATPEQVRRSGLEALTRELGTVGMVRFLQQFDMGQGDYAMDRHEWQDKMTIEDVMAQIQAARQEEAQ